MVFLIYANVVVNVYHYISNEYINTDILQLSGGVVFVCKLTVAGQWLEYKVIREGSNLLVRFRNVPKTIYLSDVGYTDVYVNEVPCFQISLIRIIKGDTTIEKMFNYLYKKDKAYIPLIDEEGKVLEWSLQKLLTEVVESEQGTKLKTELIKRKRVFI